MNRTLSYNILRIFITMGCLIICCGNLIGQDKIKESKEKIQSKIKSAIDTLKSNRMTIVGVMKANGTWTVNEGSENQFNYNISAQLQLSYKGLKIPFSYRFSQGRSIATFSGPTIRTPSFQVIGLSPAYKGWVFHIGDRSMDFSKYTYQNIRFKGIGVETKQEGLYVKSFIGSLNALGPADRSFRGESEFAYKRQAWGSLIGFKSNKIDLNFIVFSAADKGNSAITNFFVPPKENTTISYRLGISPWEKVKIEVEQAISALTADARSPRVDIQSHQSIKNMFGLFEKKSSSTYYKAQRVELFYEFESRNLSFEIESVDDGYLSLGSFNYDNNFNDYKINTGGTIGEKWTYDSSFGIRTLTVSNETDQKNSKVIINSTINWKMFEQLNVFANYSNFKRVQNGYYQSGNSTEIDTIIRTETNNSTSIGGNYQFQSKETQTLSMVYSHLNSKTVEYDAVSQNGIENDVVNIAYIRSTQNSQFTSSIGFTRTKAVNFNTTSIMISSGLGLNVGERLNIHNGLNLMRLSVDSGINYQVQGNHTLEYRLDETKQFKVDFSYKFANGNGPFSLNSLQVNIGAQWNLKPYSIIK